MQQDKDAEELRQRATHVFLKILNTTAAADPGSIHNRLKLPLLLYNRHSFITLCNHFIASSIAMSEHESPDVLLSPSLKLER